MREVIDRVANGGTLSFDMAKGVMTSILDVKHSEIETAFFLGSIRTRKETSEEIAGFLEALKTKALKVDFGFDDLIDVCGTGGDGKGTFNISTVSALVLAAGGAKVAKHGNRSVSSKCGSADVLEELGISISDGPADVKQCLEEHGFAFLMAPKFHPALGRISCLRKTIGTKTVFNYLGPLANPLEVKRQIVGVSDPELLEKYAKVLTLNKVKKAFVVCGEDGMDEFTLTGLTRVVSIDASRTSALSVTPEDFGLKRANLNRISGGSVSENAHIAEGILSAEIKEAKRDVVVMNAGAGFVAAGMAGSFYEGARLAEEAIDSGLAFELLGKLKRRK